MYRELSTKEAYNHKNRLLLENEINKRGDEINHLTTLLKMYENEKNSIIDKIKNEYKKKIENLLKKKSYYKKQVIIFFY